MAWISSINIAHIGAFVFYAFTTILFFGFGFLLYIFVGEYKKVKRMVRRPMTICDKHGPYPSELSRKLVVPAEGREDLVIEMCPICYIDRYKEADKALGLKELMRKKSE